ncbi:Poly-beta-1,6-N-acetyl-D-glucosamine N-deacetylase precursor [Actinomadura rubteroloni]|uniref:Poly-beta-1,6-N-acetyl-D-glucosamine N-deacetylase n=1 Tax=Actinomadura rubteroloni TaxID=1926885 RepID=A0A2P4UMA1_9ACTN|nr:polysaccharide deacetylase family protein [Actinomadura rubteroloni]POM26129.1 Poly-beta-1,6-N-acetyl-D-glucosamine N-deacetylase precursor [Actinomadura rubteroloni]
MTPPMPLVLMYHSVDYYEDDPHLVTITPPRFERQLKWLAARGLRGVSVRELLAAQRDGTARGLVGLTFDDGYADFATRVVPVLVRLGFTATVFALSERLGGHNAWDTGPRKNLLTAEQLAAVHDLGMEVASHGRRHVSLTGLSTKEMDDELAASRTALEDVLGAPVTGFAYPYGHAGLREVTAARCAGYDYACAIRPSFGSRHALARTYVGERDRRLRLHAKLRRHELQWRVRV